ncbi:hypothetical protein D8B26_002801 [Coccidioides posadasii str. Silveira]|uniref:carnosine N-methyltransferase n=2 Tax=Coccidioides posadasii TaxID=199306 RepID=E9CY84_COCPS|nr:conserved hypothetical protein [Coccidioides posadasii str. Silveira]QVM08103.1 hypothetical protein D8B26_002801 [Coccidioides posadasii str. Silveira]
MPDTPVKGYSNKLLDIHTCRAIFPRGLSEERETGSVKVSSLFFTRRSRPQMSTEERQDMEDGEQDEWGGEYDPLSDPQERRVLFAALDSFSQYRRFLHRNITHRRRQSFYSLPSFHWAKLSNPPFSMLDTFNKIDDAIDTNADIAEAILATGLPSFGLAPEPAEHDPRNWRNRATPEDINKANSTIRQFFRDWSAEGQHERDISYGPVLQALRDEFGERPAPGTRVLVPGAGLGRLVFDLSMAGYSAEGNEFSYHQLIASSWVLNHTRKPEEFALYPFAMGFSNLKSRSQQLKKVMIPDVHPGSAVTAQGLLPENERTMGSMSMTAADFLIQYAEPECTNAFNAVATVFFIDTAPNLIRYIETIHNCLKPGGLWINVGPLLWHYEDRHNGSQSKSGGAETDDVEKLGIVEPGTVEFTEEEIFQLVESMGFDIRKHDKEVRECGYIQDPESMLQNTYRPSYWVAAKK